MRKLFLNFWKSFSCPPQNELSVMGKSLSYKLFRFGYRLKCNIKFFLDPLWIDLKERKLTNNASKRSTVQVKDFYASSIKNWILPWEYFFPHVSIQKERKNKKKIVYQVESGQRKLLTEPNHLSIIFTMIFVCCWYSHQKCMSN